MFRTMARQGTALILGSMFWFTLAPLHAEEQTSTHGIVGLFSPDRQEDLREAIKTLPELQLVKVDSDTAEVTIRYDLAKLFPNANPKKPPTADEIMQRLNSMLGNVAQGTFRLKPLSTVPKDKLTKLEISIGILDCKACRYGAYLAITRIEGVEHATVMSSPSSVIAWIDATKTDRGAIETALKRAGVTVDPKP